MHVADDDARTHIHTDILMHTILHSMRKYTHSHISIQLLRVYMYVCVYVFSFSFFFEAYNSSIEGSECV